MQFIFLTVRLFYNLAGRKGEESLQKLSVLSVLRGKFFFMAVAAVTLRHTSLVG